MVRHKCYNEYGKLVASFDLELAQCETVILEHNGNYYKPTWYDLTSSPNIAKCIPVRVVSCVDGMSKDGRPTEKA